MNSLSLSLFPFSLIIVLQKGKDVKEVKEVKEVKRAKSKIELTFFIELTFLSCFIFFFTSCFPQRIWRAKAFDQFIETAEGETPPELTDPDLPVPRTVSFGLLSA